MSNNIYDILSKINGLKDQQDQPVDKTQTSVYEEVEAKGDLIKAIESLEKKYEDFVAEENKQLDERQFNDKTSFDTLAEPGDTYKTADGGTVTKTEKGIKHSAPSGRYGAGPEDENDDLDENTSENTSEEQLEEGKEDLRNHPIYTKEEAWDHYQKELAEQEKEETVDINTELDEISRLAGLAEKVGGNKVYGFVDEITKDDTCETCDCNPCECSMEEGFDPKEFDGEMEYMFVGDDGEEGWGHLSYNANVVDGRPVVDPNSLKATCQGDGNNKLNDEWCSEMVAPGGDEHEEALKAAQEDADEQWQERDVDIPLDEENLEEGPTRKDFQMVADLLKNVEDPAKRKELANHHADVFAKQNPRFDKARFMSAVGLNEEEVEEGNEFTKARLDAIKAGKDSFTVDGKTYKVSGDTKDEKMSESKQVNEDININVSATGAEDVINLARKLAGLPPIVVLAGGAEETEQMEEEREIEHVNTPREQVAGLSASIPSGTDLNRSKLQDPETANKAANPLAEKELEESLWTEYQSMIAEVKKDENA